MDGFDVCAILCASTIEISMYRMVYMEWGENGCQLASYLILLDVRRNINMKKHSKAIKYAIDKGFQKFKVKKEESVVKVVNDVIQGFQIDEYRNHGHKVTYLKFSIYPVCDIESYCNGYFLSMCANDLLNVPVIDTYLADEKICDMLDKIVFPFFEKYNTCKKYYGYIHRSEKLETYSIEYLFYALKTKSIEDAVNILENQMKDIDDAYESYKGVFSEEELQEKYNAFKAEKEHLNSMINRILSYTPDELDNMLIENEKRGIEFIKEHLV